MCVCVCVGGADCVHTQCDDPTKIVQTLLGLNTSHTWRDRRQTEWKTDHRPIKKLHYHLMAKNRSILWSWFRFSLGCHWGRRAGSSLGWGGGSKHSRGSPSRGSDVMRKKTFGRGGGRRKICITTSLTRYMKFPRNVFQSGVLTIR